MTTRVDGTRGPLQVERSADGIAVMVLARPEALNALNSALAKSIADALDALARDRSVRVVVVTGLGDRAFCAGADLKERSGMTDADWRRQHAAFERAFAAIRDFAKPIFAAVNGLALGGGCEVALNADFIIAADHATFGQPEVRLGIMPGGGATQHLPRRIPQGLARQLLLTGETIDAEAALRCGLVNSVHPRASLRAVALEIAGRIAQNGPAAVREARASIRGGEGLPIDEAMRVELRHYDVLVDHPDRHEGVAAFLARRPPVFRDPD